MTALSRAQSEAVAAALPLARCCARRLCAGRRLPASIEMADLVQAGALGLIDAASRFDGSRGARFTTFARPRVLGAMVDSLRAQDPLGRDERQRVRDGVRAFQLVTLEAAGSVAATPATPDDAVLRRQLGALIDRVLPQRERFVIRQHDLRGVQIRHVAAVLGVTPGRASQLRTRGLRRLRKALEKTS